MKETSKTGDESIKKKRMRDDKDVEKDNKTYRISGMNFQPKTKMVAKQTRGNSQAKYVKQ